MQTFLDTTNQQVWAFEADVIVTDTAGVYSFVAAHGAVLNTPTTLQPYTIPAPTAAQLLAAAQAAQVIILQASFNAAMALPVPFTNAAGVSTSYPNMDTVSFNGKTAMQNIEAVLNAGASAWMYREWLDVNGIAQTFTFADVQGLAAAMSKQDTPDEGRLVAALGANQRATTLAEVRAVIF